MRLGSLFDGSGGFPLAASMLGVDPVWASEIEPYPIRVTKARLPSMKHLGDVAKVDGGKIEPVDIITFGSPCQDLSIAGARRGIHDGARSHLFFDAIRIIREMRARDELDGRAGVDVRPRFCVWENVPGAFSSNGGADFKAVLEALCSVAGYSGDVPRPPLGKWGGAGHIVGDGFSIAWRVLDAQFWGVPQRRRRIFLVADFGGERAGEILFKREGLRRDHSPCGAAWENASAAAENGAGERYSRTFATQGIRRYAECDTTGCLTVGGTSGEAALVVAIDAHQQDARWKLIENGVCQTLGAKMGTGGNNTPMVMETRPAYRVRRLTPLECCRAQGFPDWWEDGVEGSDAARYKMWGNGVALPCVLYVLQGITDILKEAKK